MTEELEQNVKELTAEIRAYQHVLQGALSDIIDLSNRLDQLEEHLDKLEEKLDDLESNCQANWEDTALRSTLDEAKANLDELYQRVGDLEQVKGDEDD